MVNLHNMKKNILDYSIDELTQTISEAGFEKFRADQIFRGLHKNFSREFNSITGIPLQVKDYLNSNYEIKIPQLLHVSDSGKSETKKFLFKISDGKDSHKIETVLICEDDRRTVCVSTQVGCNVGCEFCATGKMGFSKNLKPGDIVAQVYEVHKYTGEKPTNIVFMGMGEPFLNYKNLITSLKILTASNGENISARKITVSTVGFKEKIKSFADDITSAGNESIRNVKLALSLHSTDNGFREALIPTSKRNKLSEIYEELIYFYRKTGNKITYEYILFPGLNDSENDINRLEKLSRMIPCNINVIPFHPISFKLADPLQSLNSLSDKQISLSKKSINHFIASLRLRKVVVNLRSSSGVDINAACGQLAVIENQSQ